MPADEPSALARGVSQAGGEAAHASAILARMREFRDFYKYELPRVQKFLMYNGATRDDAQDAAQEAFLEAWRLFELPPRWGWARINDRRAWIRQVALNKYRRPPGPRRRPDTVPIPAPPDLPERGPGHAELTESAMTVLEALGRIDEDARLVIALDLDEIPTSQIAGIIDATEQRVRDLRKKGRRQLNRLLTAAALEREE